MSNLRTYHPVFYKNWFNRFFGSLKQHFDEQGVLNMFRMDEEQLKALLVQNPSLRVSSHSIAHDSKLSVRTEENTSEPANKYKNYAVFVFDDGYVLDTSTLSLSKKRTKEILQNLIGLHGRVSKVFDSKKEYRRYSELQVLEKAGKICGLERQYVLVIQEAFDYRNEHIRPITYSADFKYEQDGTVTIEDVKGFDRNTGKWLTTQVFNLKWKLLKARYPQFKFVLF